MTLEGTSPVGFSRYMVYASGDVVDKSTNRTLKTTRETKSGRLIVNVMNDSWKWTKVSLARLVLTALDPLPQNWMYRYAFLTYRDGNRDNVSLENLEWDLLDYVPRSIPGITIPMTDFVVIPGYSSYEINGLSQHRRVGGNLLSEGYTSEKGYLKVRVIDDNGISRLVGIHQLMALTFLRHPIDTSSLVVNHKDGNKSHNRVENLEWVTRAENNVHAWDTGLQSRHGSILAMEAGTGNVLKFTNAIQCSVSTGLPVTTIRRWLGDRDTPLRVRRQYCIKYEDDSRDWPSSIGHTKVYAREGVPVVAKNLRTGEVKRYAYIQELADALGCNNSTIQRYLKKANDVPFRGLVIRRDENIEITDWPEYTEEELDLYAMAEKHNGDVIRVTDRDTGTVSLYGSLYDFSRESGLSLYLIRNEVAERTGKLGYQIEKVKL